MPLFMAGPVPLPLPREGLKSKEAGGAHATSVGVMGVL